MERRRCANSCLTTVLRFRTAVMTFSNPPHLEKICTEGFIKHGTTRLCHNTAMLVAQDRGFRNNASGWNISSGSVRVTMTLRYDDTVPSKFAGYLLFFNHVIPNVCWRSLAYGHTYRSQRHLVHCDGSGLHIYQSCYCYTNYYQVAHTRAGRRSNAGCTGIFISPLLRLF